MARGDAAGGELGEDAADDRGLGLVDRAARRLAAALDDVIAVGLPAGQLALERAAELAAPRLLAQIREVELRHRAEQADMHRGDLAAARDGEELHAREAQPVVEIGDIGELAAEPVERLDDDHVEAAAPRCRRAAA